ncbi:hypothetical protein [Devosia elaeis]|uniref:Uncharacterized protein n=1 Tax=Devosia elaeis TaxID=1770058 RepID=A0A178HTD4_9HYPH|nr:hypothetical protein [Devosia elaeis]OAM75294.1 hypothetical protein A3840_14755 [Devosia elaeis]
MPLLVLKGGVALAIALLATGCTYDHMQRTDRVSFRAGNAVRANMAIQTVNPSKGSQYVTTGLGASGSVMPVAPAQP